MAAGDPLPLAQEQVPQCGHAIEVRLYAEDPEAGFLPASGTLRALDLPPPSAQLRIDAGVEAGDAVTVFYDPMIAKLIVHDADRPRALARLRAALAQCHVAGPKTNLAFLEALAVHPAVVEGRIDTGYLDRHLDEFVADSGTVPPALVAACTAFLLRQQEGERQAAVAGGDPHSPLRRRRRLAPARARRPAPAPAGRGTGACRDRHRRPWRLAHRDRRQYLGGVRGAFGRRRPRPAYRRSGTTPGGPLRWGCTGTARRPPAPHTAPAAGRARPGRDAAGGDGRVLAPMPGRIVLVKVEAGQAVAAGAELLVMEAMKMELAVRAPHDGVVSELRAAAGDFVEADALLATVASAVGTDTERA